MPLDLSGPNLEATLLQQALNPPAQVQQVQQPEEPEKIGKWPWIAMLAGQGADIGTTTYALNSGRFEEANPLLGNNLAKILAIKAGAIGGNALLMKLLEKNHPTAAKAAGYIMGAGGAIPAAINLHTINKER